MKKFIDKFFAPKNVEDEESASAPAMDEVEETAPVKKSAKKASKKSAKKASKKSAKKSAKKASKKKASKKKSKKR